MFNPIKNEPVFVQGLIQAALALAIAFGLKLSPGQIGAILAFTAALLSLITRSVVTPIANPKANDGTPLLRQQQKLGAAAD